jgi:uncharacterized protein YndB with AHSA1/START domain
MSQSKKLQIKSSLKIQKPVEQVFEAIVDPQKMSDYFISKSSGRMEAGKTLIWQFPEIEMEFPVSVHKIVSPGYVSFYWDDFDGTKTLVEINLQLTGENETKVSVTESSRELDDAGIAWFGRNTEGWANFLACLKAYLEYNINLRKGAFDSSQIPEEYQQ